jgi:hypothetical protein
MDAIGRSSQVQSDTSQHTAPKSPAAEQQAEPSVADRTELSSQPGGRKFRLSGMLPADDFVHSEQDDPGNIIAPIKVPIPGGQFVPQYAPTVVGNRNAYDPAHDCDGNFTSSKFQANNNCYNYGCNIATNSFAQPGRKHGIILDSVDGEIVEKAAEKDGLMEVSHQPMTLEEMKVKQKELPPGHFVALVISQPDLAHKWPGDYHWVRCDDTGTWSQKDGGDQVTDFDFAGNQITDIGSSNWVVNQGPISGSDPRDLIVNYKFYSIMYVPDGKVDII